MKIKPTKRVRPSNVVRRKTKARAVLGGVTLWQVVKACIQQEVTAQVSVRSFSGDVTLLAEKLGYQHGGQSDFVSQADLERFAASMLEKKLASAASSDGKRVVITLTADTISILGGAKPGKPTRQAKAAALTRPLRQQRDVGDLSIPTPDQLLLPILSRIGKKPKQYADVRTAVAAQFEIPPEKLNAPVSDPVTRRRTSFADNFNLAVGHLQKATLLKSDRKKLCALPNTEGKPIPSYQPKTARARPTPTARMADRIDVQRLVKALPRQDPYKLLSMWKNAVRITDDKSRRHLHQDAAIVAEAISREWDRRAKTLADDAYFQWPTTDARGGRGKEQYRDLRHEGMLKYLEYRVGKEGEHSSYRHVLLSRIFENALPPVFDRLYMAEWGPNASSIRLHKMAHCLASFAKNFKYQNNDRYDEAIRDWEQDLEYLYDRYYVGRFGFGWPTTVI